MGREPPVSTTPNAERWTIVSDLIAGGLAGLACDSLLHPVDTVKSRLHVQKGPPFRYRSMFHAFRLIARDEGRRGLYAGYAAVIAGSIPSHAILFASYKAIKRRAEPHVDSTIPAAPVPVETQLAIVDLSAAALAEVAILPVYVPSEVIAKRMQVATLGPARNYDSVTHAARSIFRTEGASGLLNGFWATFMRDVPYTALQLGLFTTAKDRYARLVGRRSLNDIEATALGVGVGGTSAFLTNPFDVVKTRFMTQGPGSERKYYSILQCMRRMVAEEGALSLMRGVLPRILWVAPSSGIALAVYERASSIMRTAWNLEQRQPSSNSNIDHPT